MSRTFRINLTGKRFGRLVAIRFVKRLNRPTFWLWKCDCGSEKLIRADSVKRGDIRSCGCLQRDLGGNGSLKHGYAITGQVRPEYMGWISMKQRCYNPKHKSYKNYGGRGIRVCKRWLLSVENFLADVGDRPSPNYSIDRIDNNGNYEPKNVRWATGKIQVKNRRKYIRIKNRGENHHFSKLTEQEVITIKNLLKEGKSNQTQIAHQYNVTSSAISKIHLKHRWVHVN